jgi:hypothetical protein
LVPAGASSESSSSSWRRTPPQTKGKAVAGVECFDAFEVSAEQVAVCE